MHKCPLQDDEVTYAELVEKQKASEIDRCRVSVEDGSVPGRLTCVWLCRATQRSHGSD
jgi:hypothetical protein